MSVAVLAFAGLAVMIAAPRALADGSGNVDTVTGAGCMLDVYNAYGQGGGLNCTANDVSLAAADNIVILDDGCAFPGDTVSFTADFAVVVTANARHDVGIYFSQDGDPNGDGALTGACSINTPAYAPDFPWVDLDGTSDDTTNSNDFGYCSFDGGSTLASPTTPCDGGSPAAGDAQCVAALGAGATCEEFLGAFQDTCGDINSAHNPLFPSVTLTVTCVDDDGDGQLDLPYCTSWRQPGANELCLTPLAAYPGAPSKCKCDDGFGIAIAVPGQLSSVDKVTLDANGDPLPGDPTLFDFELTDVPTGTLIAAFSLDDNDPPYDSPGLDPNTYNLSEDSISGWTLFSAVCTSDQGANIDLTASGGDFTVNNGESFSCTFTNQQTFVANPVIAIDKQPDSLTVAANGSADFTLVVTNPGNVPLSNVVVADAQCDAAPAFQGGDTNNDGILDLTETWTYTCSIADVGTVDFDNVATADGDDPDGNPAPQAEDTTPVDVFNAAIAIDKQPDSLSLMPNETANFTLVVTNAGDVPLANVVVADAQCDAAPAFQGGDTNNDGILDLTETWTYTCSIADVGTVDFDNVATADANDPLGDPVPQAEDTTPVDIFTAAIAIDKQPDSLQVVANGSADFTLLVTNAGDVPLSNVVVADAQCDAAPAFQGGDDNNDGLLDVTETWTYTCSIADVGTVDFDNVATANGDDPFGDPVPEAEDTTPVDVINPAIAIDKQPDSLQVVANGSADFTLVVTNAGDVPLSNVVVADAQCDAAPAFQGGDDNNDGLLDLSETWTYTCSIADVGTADFDNVATANGDDPNGDPVPEAEDTTPVDVINPAIAIDKQPDSLQVVANGSASFTLLVTNAGDVPLSNVVVADAQCDAAPAFQGGDDNNDNILDLTETWTYTCSIADVGTVDFDNVATADADDPLGDPVPQAEDTTPVDIFIAAIAIDKQPDSLQVVANGSASFTLLVTNAGDVPLSSVVVADAQCDAAPAFQGGDDNNDGLLDLTETWTYTCSIADVGTVDFDNVATANGDDPNGDPVPEDEDTTPVDVINPAIAIDKQPDSLQVVANGSASFTLLVTNAGDVPLSNVVVADAQCDAAPAFQGGDDNNDNILDLTETWTYTCSIADVGTVDFDNVATANGDDPNGDPVPEDEDTTPVDVINPAIAIDKQPDSLQVVANGSASFTLLVTNAGDVPLSNVVVADAQCDAAPAFQGGDDNNDNILDLTETWTYTCSIADVGTVDFDNVATADADDPLGDPVPQAEDTTPVDIFIAAIAIDKQPDSLQVVANGSASFTLLVTNAGDVPLSNVVVADAQCDAAPAFQGGDTNNDGLLDLSETWTYTCSIADVGTADFDNVATANGDDPNGDPVPEAEDTTPVDVINPAIAIDKQPDSLQVVANGSASFTLVVTNDGDVPLSNVVVEDAQCDAAPAFQGGDTNNDGILDLSETWTYTCSIADVGTADFDNVATANGDDPNGDPVPEAEDTTPVDVINPAIAIDKQPDSLQLLENGSASFTLEVTNAGDVPLSNIVVADAQCDAAPAFQGGDDNNDSILDTTETWTYTCSIADVGTADFDNVATANADDPNDDPVPQAEDTTPVDVVHAEIAIDKQPDSLQLLENGAASFTLVVTNAGDVPLSNVVVADAQCDAAPAFQGGDTNNDSILDLSETWTYTCSIADVGTVDFDNVATASGDFTDDQGNTANPQAQDTTPVDVVNAAIAIDKQPDSLQLLENGAASFTLVVTNPGDVPLSNVVVADAQCDAAPAFQGGDDNNDGILDLTETWTYTCSIADVGTVDFDNVATASGDFTDDQGNTANPQAQDTTPVDVVNAAIAIDKQPDSLQLLENGAASFTLVVTNAGDVPLSNIVVADAQCDAAPAFQGGDDNNDGILDTTETWTYTCSIADVGTVDFDNVATAAGDFTDDQGNTANPQAQDTTPVDVVNAAIAIDKQPDSLQLLENGAASFTLVVTNPGDVPLSNVVVADAQCDAAPAFQGGDDNNDSILDPSETWTYTCSIADVGTVDFNNVATAAGDFTDDQGNTANPADQDTTPVDVVHAEIAIDKQPDSVQLLENGAASFTLVVTNAGDVPLSNIVVADAQCDAAPVFQGGDDNNDGILDLTETWTYTCSNADVGTVDFDNVATAAGDFTDDQGNTANPEAQDTTPVDVVNAAIAIDKQPDSLQLLENGAASFTLVVTNAGDVPLSNIVVADAQCDAAPAFQGGDDNNDGILDLTETWTYTCSKADVGTVDFDNVATATGDFTDDQGNQASPQAQDTTPVDVVNAAIAIDKQPDSLQLLENGAASFTLVVTNAGDVPLSNIVVADAQCDAAPAFQGGDDNNDGILDLTETWTYTCSKADVGTVDFDNVATATGDFTDDQGNQASPQAQDTTPVDVVNAAIAIDKQPDSLQLLENGAASFTLVVTNAGDVPLSNIVVADAQCDAAPAFQGGDDNNDGILDLTETWTYTCSIADVGMVDFDNVATATGDFTDDQGNTANPEAQDTTPVEVVHAEIAIDKQPDSLQLLENGAASFTLVVTNPGDVPLSNIVVADAQCDAAPAFQGGDDNNDGILDLSETWTYTCSIADVGMVDFDNVATATGDFTDDQGNQASPSDEDTTPVDVVHAEIDIDKTTNGTDGSEILEGATVTWRYEVTNPGDVPLGNIQVIDDQGVVPVFVSGDTNNDGILDLTETWVYEATGTAQAGAYANTGSASGDFTDDQGNQASPMADDDSSYFGGDPAIAIVKTTNGTDSSEILEGTTVTWRYEVTNAGNVPLGNIQVSDDQGVVPVFVSGDTNNDGILDLSETWVYEATGTAQAGDYANTGSASGDYTDDHGNSETANDSDDSSYFGGDPAIAINKTTNGTDGSEILEGTTVTWRYEVTNAGNVPLGNVQVSDDQGVIPVYVSGDANNDGILDLTETWIYEATGAAQAGAYANTGSASGDYTDDHGNSETAESDDPSSYFGGDPAIAIVKTTNGTDGSEILEGTTVTWRYEVTNTGNVPLGNIQVSDDQGVVPIFISGDDNNDGILDLNETWVYEATGTAQAGDYANTGSASGDYTDDHGNSETAEADDPSSYFGGDPAIAIDKTTNGTDGSEILEGTTVTWRYEVTNAGNVPLGNIQVSDDQGVVPVFVSGDDDNDGILDLTETWIYEATGTAQAGDYANTGSASGDYTDDHGNSETANDSDDSSYFGGDPAIAIDKTTNGTDGSEILEGTTVTWRYEVSNAGNVPLGNIQVSDDQGVIPVYVSGDANNDDILDLDETWVYEATGTAQAGDYANTGLASGDYTDDHSNSETAEADDPSSYFGGDPAISIVKTFTDDSVIAGGAGSSFTLLVTNEGNVPLSDVLVTDSVDLRLGVTDVTVTTPTSAGDEDCSATAGQDVSCTIPTLAVGESAEITVNFAVDSSVPEALEEEAVPNTADVEGDYTDDHNNSETVTDDSMDTIDILTEIELEIIKNFYRFDDDGNLVDIDEPFKDTIEQGMNGFFELIVTNNGPSDALAVVVTDTVNGVLEVVNVQPALECAASSGQDIDCTFDIAVGQIVTVTVEYTAAEFLDSDEPSSHGTVEGDDFRFVFVNGYILEGSSDTDGAATLIVTAPDGFEQVLPYDGTKNELNFDPSLILDAEGNQVFPDDPAFSMHLSCSDAFFGGWGEGGASGPVEGTDVNWQIASWSILRYNQNGFFKGCGDTVVPDDVPNTAFADGTDSNSELGEDEQVSDTASVQVIRQLKIEIRNQPVIKGKKADVLLVNTGLDPLTITQIEITWPYATPQGGNGDLDSVKLGHPTIYDNPDLPGPDATIGPIGWPSDPADRTIEPGQALKLGFFFQKKAKGNVGDGLYTIIVTLEGGLTIEVTSITF